PSRGDHRAGELDLATNLRMRTTGDVDDRDLRAASVAREGAVVAVRATRVFMSPILGRGEHHGAIAIDEQLPRVSGELGHRENTGSFCVDDPQGTVAHQVDEPAVVLDDVGLVDPFDLVVGTRGFVRTCETAVTRGADLA